MRFKFFLFCLLTGFSSQKGIAANLCKPATALPAMRLEHRSYSSAETGLVDLKESQTSLSRFSLDWSREENSAENYQSDWGYSHSYRAFDFEEPANVELQSNGDHHRLMLKWLKPFNGDWGTITVGLAPLLSISSNQLKDTHLINRDGWQIHGNIYFSSPIAGSSQEAAWITGICIDDRFDHLKAYPVLGIQGGGDSSFNWRLAYPDSHVNFLLNAYWSIELEVSPSGSRWQVYNESLDNYSPFRLAAWQTQVSLNWNANQAIGLSLSFGLEVDRELEFLLVDGSLQSLAAENASFASLEFSWRW